jgi:UDP-glucose 4-epimerase
MARYLVTGGAGFIGSWLVERLLAAGTDEVVSLDNLATGLRSRLDHQHAAGARTIIGDVADLDQACAACAGVDIVFHQAAIPSVPRSLDDPLGTHRANVTGTLTLLEAARRSGVRRVVYAASSSAYGGAPHELPKREQQQPTPLSPYAAAKLAGEFYCRAYHASFGLETVCLRYFNIFGPGQDPGSPYAAVLPRFVRAMLTDQAPLIYGDGLQTRDFTYVANAVEANWLAGQAPATFADGRCYNIGCGEETSLLAIVELLGEINGRPLEPRFEPARAGDPRRSVADISRAGTELGYVPRVGLREGLTRLVAHMRQR